MLKLRSSLTKTKAEVRVRARLELGAEIIEEFVDFYSSLVFDQFRLLVGECG